MSHVTNPVVNIYVDGTLKVTNTGSGTVIDTNENLKIGRYTSGNPNDFDGKIHAIRVYNTVLTSAEVAQNFRAGNNLSYSSVITSKHEATQGALYSTNLALSLDANGYSSGAWSNTANSSYNATVNGAAHYNDNNSDYFDFDGSNDYAEVAAYAGTDIGSGGFTIEAWALCEASSGQDTIVSNIGSNLAGYQLYIQNGTDVKLYMYSGGANYWVFDSASSAVTVGTWNHYVLTVASADFDYELRYSLKHRHDFYLANENGVPRSCMPPCESFQHGRAEARPPVLVCIYIYI